MAKRGPKPVVIDWDEFDKLCYIQATLNEIASWFDCSEDTIERRVVETKRVKFAEYYSKKRGRGKISLRRRQFQAAESGNTTMLIWLGKQYLDQKDQHEVMAAEEAFSLAYSFKPNDTK